VKTASSSLPKQQKRQKEEFLEKISGMTKLRNYFCPKK
jgi:hypothetical protein